MLEGKNGFEYLEVSQALLQAVFQFQAQFQAQFRVQFRVQCLKVLKHKKSRNIPHCSLNKIYESQNIINLNRKLASIRCSIRIAST